MILFQCYKNVLLFAGYGNIAPKTSWGRIVTIIYALAGIPLFFVWASQMGEFCANVFKFCYHNICCGLCNRGKRRKALALAAKTRRQEMKHFQNYDALGAMHQGQQDSERVSNFEGGSLDQEIEDKLMPFSEGGAVKVLAATPLPLANHLVNGGSDSGVHSQQSLTGNNVKLKSEILQPEIKELLSTCAQYNLDNTKNNDSRSAELLEEIRHAEVIESIRAAKKGRKSSTTSSSLPQSPLKVRQLGVMVHKDGGGDGSLYENSPEYSESVTPLHMRKGKLGHSTIIMMDHNGSPVTTLIKVRI